MKDEKYLSVDEIIKRAQKIGVSFGKGQPYNRLRYYTKMGLIPRMERKGKNVQGHYPEWVINRLKLIQELGETGLSHEKILNEIEKEQKIAPIKNLLKSEKFRKKLIIVAILLVTGILVLNEIGIIKVGLTAKDIIPSQQLKTPEFP